MSIRVRIFGGFFSILLLTICVAGVAWKSLSEFASGAGVAVTAQSLSSASSHLAVAANKAIGSGTAQTDPAVRDGRSRVRALIGALSQADGQDEATAQAVTAMTGALDGFESGLAALNQQSAAKLALQRSHRALVEEFQTTVGQIGDAQRDSLKAAVKNVETGLAEQVAFTSLNAVVGHTIRSVYELRCSRVAWRPMRRPARRPSACSTWWACC